MSLLYEEEWVTYLFHIHAQLWWPMLFTKLHLLSYSLSLLFRRVSYMRFSRILWSVDW